MINLPETDTILRTFSRTVVAHAVARHSHTRPVRQKVTVQYGRPRRPPDTVIVTATSPARLAMHHRSLVCHDLRQLLVLGRNNLMLDRVPQLSQMDAAATVLHR